MKPLTWLLRPKSTSSTEWALVQAQARAELKYPPALEQALKELKRGSPPGLFEAFALLPLPRGLPPRVGAELIRIQYMLVLNRLPTAGRELSDCFLGIAKSIRGIPTSVLMRGLGLTEQGAEYPTTSALVRRANDHLACALELAVAFARDEKDPGAVALLLAAAADDIHGRVQDAQGRREYLAGVREHLRRSGQMRHPPLDVFGFRGTKR